MPQVNLPGNSRHLFSRGASSPAALAAAVTLTGLSSKYQFLNPNGTTRQVTLPGYPSSFGLEFVIMNTDATAILTVVDSASVAVGFIPPQQTMTLICDGATWSVVGGGAKSPLGFVFKDLVSHNSAQGTNEVFSTFSLPANVLNAAGRAIRVHAWGTTAANGNNKLLRLAFGTNVAVTSGVIAANNKDWELFAMITATAVSAQIIDPSGATFNGIRWPILGALTATEVSTAAITVATQNTAATAAADIVQQGMTVEVIS